MGMLPKTFEYAITIKEKTRNSLDTFDERTPIIVSTTLSFKELTRPNPE